MNSGKLYPGRSRGFGFVRFQDPSSVKKVMKEKHYLGNKLVEVKKAEPKNALLMASEAIEQSKLSEASWSNASRAPTGGPAGIVLGTSGNPLGVIPLVPGLVPMIPSPRSSEAGAENVEGLLFFFFSPPTHGLGFPPAMYAAGGSNPQAAYSLYPYPPGALPFPSAGFPPGRNPQVPSPEALG